MAFLDSLILLVNDADATKQLRFDLSNQPTGTTRVIQLPLADTTAGVAVARGLFGDGSDGDVTISSACSFVRDMYFENLTVDASVDMQQHRLFVKGTLTVNGTLLCRGGFGVTTFDEVGGLAGVWPGGGTLGQVIGCNGTDGATATMGAGTQAEDPIAVWHAGGGGGYGGAGGVSANGNAGGAQGVRNNAYPWIKGNLDTELTATDLISANRMAVRVAGGLGGRGGSAGGGETGVALGRGGGGGGAGGGVMMIFARTIVNNGSINAEGTVGGDGNEGPV